MKHRRLVGQVALSGGEPLTGVIVNIDIDGTSYKAITDSIGEFRIDSPICQPAQPYPEAEVAVLLPDNQVIYRGERQLDGRYIGLTIPRASLPRIDPLRSSPLRPTAPAEFPVESRDLGDSGQIQLPEALPSWPDGTPRIAAAGDKACVVSGRDLRIWTITGRHALPPDKVEVDFDVLDIAADPLHAEIVLLVAGSEESRGRQVLALTGDGRLQRRWAGTGDWDLLAVSPEDGALALAAAGFTGWAALDEGELRVHELDATVQDLAYAGTTLVIDTSTELLTLDSRGKLLSSTPWPGSGTTLESAGDNAVVRFDPTGRATRVHDGRDGQLTVDVTIFIGRGATLGWWQEKSLLLALQEDNLRWWQFANTASP